MAASLEARLLASIEPDTSQWGCWLWARGVQSQGYGALRWDGRMVQAHRAAFTLWVGPIPVDRPHVCHHCDTRPCIRPDHLFAGTDADNVADMLRKGRQRPARLPGETNPAAKLTEAQVLEILAIPHDVPQRVVAAMYGVNQRLVWAIRARKKWRHLVAHMGLYAPGDTH